MSAKHKTIISVCAILAVAVSFTSPADTVTLRNEAYVKGPVVRLGDVAEIRGGDADYLKAIELAPAALPGASKRFDASLVRARLSGAGVDASDVAVEGSRRVRATTLHLEVTRGMLRESLREYIRREMPWDLDATTIEVTPPPNDFLVSDGEVDLQWRPNPQFRYLGSGSFRGQILVDGRVEKTFFTKALVETYQEVVVASTAIGRGEAIGLRNAWLEQREISALRGGAFLDLDEVSGYVAKSSIRPGDVIMHRNAVPPILVKRNQVIAVETRIGALTIRGRCRALADAAAGELVTCASLESKEKFTGVVRADGVVVVP